MAILTLAPSLHERIIAEPTWRDELVFVCSWGHNLATRKNVTINELAEYAAILPDMATFTGRIVKGIFKGHDLLMKVSMSNIHLETIKMLIGAGLGWSVLPKTMLDDHVVVLNISVEFDLAPTSGVRCHAITTLSNAGEVFINLLREAFD